MISEVTFIKYYSNFWNDLIPGIDNYLRIINKGLKERIDSPIELEDIPERRILINAISDFLLVHIFNSIDVSDFSTYLRSDEYHERVNSVKNNMAKELKRFDKKKTFSIPLSQNEYEIIKRLNKNVYIKYKRYKKLIYKPNFQGCGLLFATKADLFYKDTLVEIKAGNRYFQKHDLIQLIIYGALNTIQNDPFEINYFELYNPRVGINWHENVNTISIAISGAPVGEIYSEIINYISNDYISI